jgi:ectoine hydroxylase-related dioxygenase (phytanoyl-CoA dioxygenase family)
LVRSKWRVVSKEKLLITGLIKMYIKNQIEENGFSLIDNIYSESEIKDLLFMIETADPERPTFRKTGDLFAIRQFFKEIPGAINIVFNEKLQDLIATVYGDEYFVVKSIYFDKPPNSNWFVSYHQDLTISVDKKIQYEGFGPWTIKQDQFAVQPPVDILKDNFTIRIHLDKTTNENGALKVIPGSHLRGIFRPETIDHSAEQEVVCNVERGGAMFMKPLLLHSSGRTSNQNKRRIIHIEFSRIKLPSGLNWSEFMPLKAYH